MPPFNVAMLILLTVVFALWVYLMFRMLARLARQSMEGLEGTNGGYFAWIRHSFQAFEGFFSDPSVTTERRQLLWVTILLMLITIAQPFLLVGGK